MSDDKKKETPDEARARQAQAGEAETSALAQPGAESDIAEPEPFTELENLHAEVASLKDKLLRTLADMENLRRRTEKEIADAKTYGVTNFAREMLPLADNLRRAVDSVPAQARDGLEQSVCTLIEGVELTERDFVSRLARFGVKKIEAQGQRFDPNQHEALFEIPDESVPNGTVAQVVEPGYLIGERVLRPAKVGVARGGPKA
ncbi:nucleotide exchange factor GrpE [Methylosinus sp. Ce-a6]|uniref:nucleotide exchange factor GrpE n=1 Tax=Methylosinus sp. Ce-a6 TaxID=2172005 RepID=UPI00135C5FC9|nr:nucleotide exchange factor GrpE [Methylosinus sp. Ce-a6]